MLYFLTSDSSCVLLGSLSLGRSVNKFQNICRNVRLSRFHFPHIPAGSAHLSRAKGGRLAKNLCLMYLLYFLKLIVNKVQLPKFEVPPSRAVKPLYHRSELMVPWGGLEIYYELRIVTMPDIKSIVSIFNWSFLRRANTPPLHNPSWIEKASFRRSEERCTSEMMSKGKSLK